MKWTDFQEYSIYQCYILIESLTNKSEVSIPQKPHQTPTKHRFVIKHLRKSNVNLTEAPPETRGKKPLYRIIYGYVFLINKPNPVIKN